MPFSNNTLSVNVILKGWDSYRLEKDLICYWREVKLGKNIIIFPFSFQESHSPKTALREIFSIIGECELVKFRRRKLAHAEKKLEAATCSLEESKKRILSLELENEKFQQLVAELYAPGGTLAEEARKEYESLSRQGN